MDEMVLTAAQLKCLASPACNDVVAALGALGTVSATELARRLDRSPATVLYHLRRLVGCELVREVGRRSTARKPEALYALSARRLRLPEPAPGSEAASYQRQAVLASLRKVMRGYEKAAQAPEPDLQVIRAQIRLSEENRRRFQELIEEASRFADTHRDESAPRFLWSSVLYPDI